jgi:hypothetical protein
MALVLALGISIGSMAHAANISTADAWRPMHPFIGTWRGSRAGADGSLKVTRTYASSPTNHHLEIREKLSGQSGSGLWGVVSFDQERRVLVVRRFIADGSTFDVNLDPSAPAAGALAFESPESEPARTRITYVTDGTKSFVERVERSSGGEPFSLVSETRFVRAD